MVPVYASAHCVIGRLALELPSKRTEHDHQDLCGASDACPSPAHPMGRVLPTFCAASWLRESPTNPLRRKLVRRMRTYTCPATMGRVTPAPGSPSPLRACATYLTGPSERLRTARSLVSLGLPAPFRSSIAWLVARRSELDQDVTLGG